MKISLSELFFFLGGCIGMGVGHVAYSASRKLILSILTLKLQQGLGTLGLFLFGIGGGLMLSLVRGPLALFTVMVLFGIGGVFCLAMASRAQ